MLTYRARACPKCQYYLGYSVQKTLHDAAAAVESFCLNCNYRLPMRAVIRGQKNVPSRRKSNSPSDLLHGVNDFHAGAPLASTAAPAREARAPNYPRDLRAIGQELERRGFKTFNLKCSGDAYFVWSTETPATAGLNDGRSSAHRSGRPVNYDNPADPASKALFDRIVGFSFGVVQIERLEKKGKENRRNGIGFSEHGRLSHLLRTVGDQVYHRNDRLLAIAWREKQISVVTRNAAGRHMMDVLRSDNLYDLWVRMYLKRSH